MRIDEALKQIKDLKLPDDFSDFSTWEDEELLKIEMNTMLSSVNEVERFLEEMKKRNLYDYYFKNNKL